MNPNEKEIAEIKEKLKQMRAENRLIATENRMLLTQISQLEHDTQLLQQQGSDQSKLLTATLTKLSKEIDNEVAQRNTTRKERKKQILTEIRQKTEENKNLSNQVKDLENEILRIKQIQDTYSTGIARSKIRQAKRNKVATANTGV